VSRHGRVSSVGRIAGRRRITILTVVAVFGLLIWAADSSIAIYRVSSASMEPALHCAAGPGCARLKADVVLVSRLTRITGVGRGDIVAFRAPDQGPEMCRHGGVRLKRVIGLPGDIVTGRGGSAHVLAARSESARAAAISETLTVPSNEYFVMSDNPRGSCDSRQIGPIPKGVLIGKVVLVYSPRWTIRRP
jgi:signal peptidase I